MDEGLKDRQTDEHMNELPDRQMYNAMYTLTDICQRYLFIGGLMHRKEFGNLLKNESIYILSFAKRQYDRTARNQVFCRKHLLDKICDLT